jgi:hypothetical protein
LSAGAVVSGVPAPSGRSVAVGPVASDAAPVEAVVMAEWERMEGESARAYEAFRLFRDDGPRRTVDGIRGRVDVSERTLQGWSSKFDWRDRSLAWDDECARVEDRQRLDDIRTMYDMHRRVGRVAVTKALQALQNLPVDRIPPGAAARLLELGTRIERQTLGTSPEDFYGVTDEPDVEDAFATLARELDATPS